MNIFAKNLKQFRLQKHLTQEQAAEALGVSAQTVSRWECATTLPDVTILPRIARLYGVMVDDLYRESSPVYPNYANRLLAVYEKTGQLEDFVAAHQEFSRIRDEDLTPEDLRGLGVLHHYMMQHSAEKALYYLDRTLVHPELSADTRSSAAQQKIALLCDLGKGSEEALRYDGLLASQPSEPLLWVLCTAAHYMAGEPEQALDTARRGLARFPENAALHIYAGYVFRDRKEYAQAFSCWEQVLKLDPDFWDARYAMGFCLEQMGEYARAREVWRRLALDLERKGFEEEVSFPLNREQFCAKQCT